ncbi:MAG: hypothetical protein JO067_15070 [Cupriavidus sp.]|nr:hypothetical protein [Cupriavidus sp.]
MNPTRFGAPARVVRRVWDSEQMPMVLARMLHMKCGAQDSHDFNVMNPTDVSHH